MDTEPERLTSVFSDREDSRHDVPDRDTVWFLVFAGISALLLWWGVISREERYLERKFGAQYLTYKARVRRWL